MFYRRYTSNGTLFNELLEKVRTIPPEVVIGGNAATIARRLTLEGFDVLLAATMTKYTRKLFPKNMKGELIDNDSIR